MANDPTIEKRLRNARRFELIYSLLTPQEKETALSGSDEELGQILTAKGIKDISGTLLSRRDWIGSRDLAPQPEAKEPKEQTAKGRKGNVFTDSLAGWNVATPPPPKKDEDEEDEGDEETKSGTKTETPSVTNTPNAPTSQPTKPSPTAIKSESAVSNQTLPRVEPNTLEPTPVEQSTIPAQQVSSGSVNDVGYYPHPEIVPEEYIINTPPVSEPTVDIPPIEPEPPDTPPPSTQPRASGVKKRGAGKITRGVKAFNKGGARGLAKQGAKVVVRPLLPYILAIAAIIFGIFFLIIIILLLGCSVVNNPIGDFFGANYCGNNPQQPLPAPPPGPQEKPTSVTFVGGEAYLTTADGCRVNCPAGAKGDKVTINVIINVDTSKLNTDPGNLRANVQISNKFFSNIEATGNPQIIGIPVDTTYFVYQWRLPNAGGTIRRYEYKITGILQAESGETNAILSMSGVTLTSDGSTGGENGGLFEGSTARPSNNTCNKYGGTMNTVKQNFSSVQNANFGDPLCTYSDAKLNKVIEQTEKNIANQNLWKSIAKCETISPNAYVPNSVGGSWGKFQMRRSFPNPFKIWTQADDRGDVTWQKQVENAVSYNNSLARDGKNFSYWGTARCLCYYDKFKNTSSCKDIIRRGEVRSPGGSCSSCTASEGKS